MLKVCRKCGTLLKRGTSYCMKCGYNNATGYGEQLTQHEIKKSSSKTIVITVLSFLIFIVGLCFIYILGQNQIKTIIGTLSNLKLDIDLLLLPFLGFFMAAETVLAYRFLDDGFVKSIGEYLLLCIFVGFGIYIYNVIQIKHLFLPDISLVTLFVEIGLAAILYFIAKKISSLIALKCKTNNPIIVSIFFIILRCITWILYFMIIYYMMAQKILPI